MADASEETKSKILASAKAEFLEKGFTNASLRTIAANAGLTTGAMYRHFKDKDALFCALVDDAIDETLKIVKTAGVSHHETVEGPIGRGHEEDEIKFMNYFTNYMFENKDAFVLLLTKAAGSTHENFLEEVSDIYTENVIATVNWMKEKYNVTKPIDDMSLHVFSNTVINAYAEVILHNMDMAEAEIFMSNIQEFFHFGFMHLLGLPCDD